MNKKIIKILSTILICLIIFLFWRFVIKEFVIKEIREFRIDHQCYMMTDEEFFQTEMCKPYWSYRQVGKK